MKDHNKTDIKSCCHHEQETKTTHVDPVCGMGVVGDDQSMQYIHNGQTYYFCNNHCLKSFEKNPASYLEPEPDTAATKQHGINAVGIGLTGGSLLLLIFFGIVTLANGTLESAFQEFQRLWYWIVLLASGFGFQLGLFFHIKNTLRENMAGATAEIAASGTISTGSMIACCSHGLINLLPILGVSAAAAFLAQYQQPLILLGVFSNLVGITIMLGIAKKHAVLPRNLLGRLVDRWNLKVIRHATVIVGVLAILGSSYWAYLQ